MESIARNILDRLSPILKQQTSGDIYHYSDISGIKGIIETKELWATSAFYLNDKNEIYHSFNLIRERLEESFDKTKNLIIGSAKHDWNHLPKPKVFVFSFSKNKNSLSQWRGYGKNGNAYCISFDRILLSKCTLGLSDIFDVIYDENIQIEIVDKTIEYFINDPSIINTNSNGIHFKLLNMLAMFLPLFKDQNFSEENEVRLVVRDDSIKENNLSIEYRCSDSILIPYVKIDYLRYLEDEYDFPISEIMVGPNKNQNIAEESLSDFCKKVFNKPIAVISSQTPFRV